MAFTSALLTSAAAHAGDGPPKDPSLPSIPFTQTKLKNGMVVLLHEDHTVPITVVNISYNVGSRFEAERRSGFAHLFEHLMFMGTQKVPTKAFDAWMENAGGWNNAWTSEDRTDYYDVAPPTALPLLLWLEADRIRDLGTFMTKEKLDAQREVVRNERRQSSENRPYGKVELRLPELLYPANHPYHHPVIGSHEDLEAATVDDVKEFFATWYDPANASMVVAGDFDPKAVMPQIEALFGSIPTRGRPKDPGAPGFDADVSTVDPRVRFDGKKVEAGKAATRKARETLRDNVELAKVVLAWPSPKHFADGDAELELLASILADGKASRLYKSLVYDQKIAQEVGAGQENGVLGSRFVIEALARPGVSLETLEKAIAVELSRVRTKGVTDEELIRAKNLHETGFVTKLESVRERASLLNMYLAEVGNPGFIGDDLSRYRKATAAGVKTYADRVLSPDGFVAIHVVPNDAPAESKKTAKQGDKK
jgi:zinc protease